MKSLSKIALCMVAVSLLTLPADAQLFGKKKKKEEDKTEEPKAKPDKLKEAVKGKNQIEGLFTLYQDTLKGDLQMLITAEQLEKQFIHFYYTENGFIEGGTFKGNYKGSRIFKISRYFNRLEFSIINTSYYFDPEMAISKAAEANITDATIYSANIKATSKGDSAFLIDVDKLFLSETFGLVKPTNTKPNSFNIGNLSGDKTKYSSIRNYPENTDVVVEYVYQNGSPKNTGSDAIADPRSTSIKVQHSLVAVPDNDFEPRFDDPRIGYFTTQVTDLTSNSTTPYRDLINKFHLKKKYPDSALSEPVKPITWWIENTTPLEIRPTIEKAALSWNIAFEKAGFKNAVVVKTQPDTATWDAGDIRYNVLRWTSSPQPPFGGYGPRFANPLTGEILGADVMLEYSVLGRLARLGDVFSGDGSEIETFVEEAMEHTGCAVAHHGMVNNTFAHTALEALDDDDEWPRIVEEWLHYLILHEIGHTLGLNHNMKASQLHGLDNIHNTELTSEVGLMGSVMDYGAINFNKNREEQGQYYITRPGPYDLWAIEFEYTPNLTEDQRNEILSRSTEPGLVFGNDADDMRAPGRGIDPRVNVFDQSSDAVAFGVEAMELADIVLDDLLEKYLSSNENTSYDELRVRYSSAINQYYRSSGVISRYIGGVYVDRSFVGQEGASRPFTPVPEKQQKAAMQALEKHIFSPAAFAGSDELYSYLQKQRRGFEFYSKTEDPKLHSSFLSMQQNVLSHLLNPTVLNRIVDTELYGNDYKLAEVMEDLHNAIFKADEWGSVNSIRQNLQTEYVNRLIAIIDGKSSHMHSVKAMAFYNLRKAREVASRKVGNTSTRAHRAHLVYLIDSALED